MTLYLNKKRLSAYGALLLTSIIWGVAGPVIKHTLGDFPPLIFLTYRFGLSAIIGLLMIAQSPQDLPRNGKQWTHVLGYSLFVPILGLGLIFFGFNGTTSLSGTLIAASTPIFAAIAGALAFREKFTRMEKIGISIALVGTFITAVDGSGLRLALIGSIVGNLFILSSGIIQAVGAVFSKKSVDEHFSPLMLTNLSFVIAFMVFLPLTLYVYTPHVVVETLIQAPIGAHLGVIYMAVLSGTLGYFLSNWSELVIGIGEGGIFSYLLPVWALPISMIWLGERLTMSEIIGGIVIAAGVCIAEVKRRQLRKKQHRKRNR